MAKPRNKKQIHQDIDNYVIIDEKIIGNVPAGKFKNTITFDGIMNAGTPMTNNQLAALIAKLTITVNEQHNLVMGEIKDIKLKLDKHQSILEEHTNILKRHEAILEEHTNILKRHQAILTEHTAIFAHNNLK